MKTVVVTGATSGIGFATVRALAEAGAFVIGVGRTPERCRKARERLLAAVPDASIEYVAGDLSAKSGVHAVADGVLKLLERTGGVLNVLINNAGGVRSGYTLTADGYELQFALNHLAGFLLTCRLWSALKAAGGRVIMTGSNSHKMMRMHWRDVMYARRYSPLMAYKQSKLCNMLFARELDRRFPHTGVRAYVVDPGLVNTDIGSKQTRGIVSAFWSLRRRGGDPPEVPARTYVYLSTRDPAPPGLYYHNCREASYNPRADNEQDAARLWALSERLCGVVFGE